MSGLVVLRTKAQNGFCPMCTKRCYMVLTCSKPFWGQFWGQIRETGSDLHQSYKLRGFGSIEKCRYLHRRVLASEKPYEPVYKFYSQARSCTQELLRGTLAHRPCRREKRPGLGASSPRRRAVPIQPNTAPNSPPLGRSYPRTAFPVQALPRRVSPVQEKPAQINTK